MKTSTAIIIDRTLVHFFVLCLNLLVRFAGLILRIDHSLDKSFRTIVICKFKGIGSILQSTPLVHSLRITHPNARLIYVSSISNKAVLEEIEWIDEVILLDDRRLGRLLQSFPGFILRLIRHRIDLYIDLEIYSDFSSLITTLSLARNRIGYYLRSSEFRMGIYTHMMYFNIRVPIYQTYLQIARLIKATISDKYYSFPHAGTSGLEKALTLKPSIVINPNASDLRIERRWPHKNFIRLIGMLNESFPEMHIFLIGGRDEMAYVDEIAIPFMENQKVHNLSGQTSFLELTSLLKTCNLLITNDTGPLHLAAAVKSPTVALFGPCAPSQYGDMQNVYTIYKNVYCSPCVHEFPKPPCKGDNQCMKQITPEEVFQAATKVLTGKWTPIAANESTIFFGNKQQALGLVRR